MSWITTDKRSKSLSQSFEPDKYQIDTIKFAISRPAFGILSDPGFGKTMCVLSAFKILKTKGFVERLIVMSKRRIIYQVWPHEILKWGMPFSHQILHGNKFRREMLLEEPADVQLLNFDSLPWLYDMWFRNKRKVNAVYDGTLFVIDESTGIKNTNTQRFRMLRPMAKKISRRGIMTGTPTPLSLLDIYAQIWFLDLGKALGYKTAFKNEFFVPSGYMGYQWSPMKGAEEKVYEKISHLVIRFSEELIKVPEVKQIPRRISLGKEARKHYDEMEKEFIFELESGVVTSSNAAGKTSKLRQIASGGVYDENHKYHFIHHEKTEDLEDLVEELNGKPVLIGCEFKHDLERLREFFPDIKYVGGGTTDKDFEKIQRMWNQGKLRYLAGHYSSIAHGLNLQEVDAVIYCYSLTTNLEYFDQFIRRLKRRGSKSKIVKVYTPIVEESIDEVFLAALERKAKNQKQFLSLIEQHYLEGHRMVSTVVKDRTENFMKAVSNLKEKVKPYDGDMNKLVRHYRGFICSLKNEALVQFIKDSSGEMRSVKEQTSSLVEKAYEILEDVFKAKYDEKKGVWYSHDEIFTVVYPTKGDDSMSSKFAGPSSAKKKTSKKKFGGKKTSTDKKKTSKKKTAAKKKTATKKATSKKAQLKKKKAVKGDLEGTVVRKEGEPKMSYRKEILELVPKGTKGIKAETLVSKVVEEVGGTERKAKNNILGMVEKGFIAIK